MPYLGSYAIDNLLTFPANTHTASTGAATDADSVPSYRVYEDETGTPILTGTMSLLDSANTAGFYSEQITLSAANGFEVGKSYTIYVSATVAAIVGTLSHTFQVGAPVSLIPAAIVTASFAAGAINAAAIAADAIGASELAADAVTEIQAAVAAGAVASVTGAVGSVTGNVGGNVVGSVGSLTTNNDKTGYALSSAGVQAIWDALTSALTTANSIGKRLVDFVTTLVYAAPPTAAANADAVWDEAAADHLTGGTFGEAEALSSARLLTALELDGAVYRFTANALEQAPTGGSAPSAATIADAVWDEARAGHTAGGSFGEGVASVQGNVTGSAGSITGNVGGAVGSVTARVTANVDQLNGVAQSLLDLKDFADDGYDPATNKVQGVVLADTVTTLTGHTPQTGDAFARIGANGAGLSAVPWNAAWDAEVQSEVQDAVEVNHLDHLLAVDYDPAAKPGVATALLNELVESDAGVSRYTANALEQAPTGGTAPTALAIADAVWDEARADHTGAASFGGGIAGFAAALFAGITSLGDWLRVMMRDDGSFAAALGEVNTGGGDYSPAVSLQGLGANTGYTAEVVAKLDPMIEDTIGGPGENYVFTAAAMVNAGGGGGGDATEANQVLILAGIANLDTGVDAVAASLGAVAADVDAIQGIAEQLPNGGALSNLDQPISTRATRAEVAEELLDALTVDTYPEVTAPPAAISSINDRLAWIFALARNKRTQTATTELLRNDADSATIGTAIKSDDGSVFIRGEYS